MDLRWNAPDGCPTEEQIQDRIRKLAGSTRSKDSPLRAEATVTRSEGGALHLELVVRVGELVGTRRIDGRSCEDLAGATAVALALLLRSPDALDEEDLVGSGDATSSGDGSDERGQSTAGRDSESEAERATNPASVESDSDGPTAQETGEEPAPTRSWRVLVQAPLASFGLGPLPEASFGLAAAAGVSVERWRFLVEGGVWPKQAMVAPDEPGVMAQAQLFTGGLRACWEAFEGRFQLGPCAAVAVRHVRARGEGDQVLPRTAAATWIAAGAGMQASWRLAPWLGLVGGATAQIEGERPRITIDDVGTLGQTRPVSLTLAIGTEWIL